MRTEVLCEAGRTPGGISSSLADSDTYMACVCAQSCPTHCNSMDCSLPGSSIRGIYQARIPEWVAISSSRGSSDPGVEPASLVFPALAGRFFTPEPPDEKQKPKILSRGGMNTQKNYRKQIFMIHITTVVSSLT